MQEVAAAAYYLPTYDLRQATLAVSALKEQLEAAKAALQPRKKFSFSSRRAQGAKAQPAAAAAAGSGGGDAAAAAAAAPPTGDGSSSSTLQQLLGTGAAASTSGRCAPVPCLGLVYVLPACVLSPNTCGKGVHGFRHLWRNIQQCQASTRVFLHTSSDRACSVQTSFSSACCATGPCQG